MRQFVFIAYINDYSCRWKYSTAIYNEYGLHFSKAQHDVKMNFQSQLINKFFSSKVMIVQVFFQSSEGFVVKSKLKKKVFHPSLNLKEILYTSTTDASV